MSAQRFRKKPVEIEAMQWDGHPGTAMMVCVWINSRFGAATFSAGRILIRTLEGDMEASPGDYVIKGVQGEFYPIKDAIFRETYEPVEGES